MQTLSVINIMSQSLRLFLFKCLSNAIFEKNVTEYLPNIFFVLKIVINLMCVVMKCI